MASQSEGPTSGSRTAAYLTAGLLASLPAWFLVTMFLGMGAGIAAVVVCWTSGLFWLAKKRHEDPAWDRRPVGQ